MSQPDTKYLRTLIKGLDRLDIISIMERLHAAAASGQLKMNEARDPQSRQAIVQAAMGLLEEDRAKLDVLLGAFKELYSGTASSSSASLIPNGSDVPGGAPKDAQSPRQAVSSEANTPAEVATSDAKLPTQAAPDGVLAALPQYFLCDTCEFFVKPGVSHTCTKDGPASDCYNTFHEEELDIIHGAGGWEEVDPSDIDKAGAADGPTSHDKVPGHHIQVPIQKRKVSLEEESDTESPEDILRPSSKLERVYKLIKELIETNGPQHIDNMLEPARKRQLFLGVQSPRANLANFLSKLKARGLLASDNRGFWSFPEKKAGS